MKRILVLGLIICVIATFTACSGKTYVFKRPIEEIASVEIVSAENSLTYTVVKKLSDIEKNDFLQKFQQIPFNDYVVGDPMTVNGNAVKITYPTGDYEIICYYWAEYVSNGQVASFIWRNCSENSFRELLESFL